VQQDSRRGQWTRLRKGHALLLLSICRGRLVGITHKIASSIFRSAALVVVGKSFHQAIFSRLGGQISMDDGTQSAVAWKLLRFRNRDSVWRFIRSRVTWHYRANERWAYAAWRPPEIIPREVCSQQCLMLFVSDSVSFRSLFLLLSCLQNDHQRSYAGNHRCCLQWTSAQPMYPTTFRREYGKDDCKAKIFTTSLSHWSALPCEGWCNAKHGLKLTSCQEEASPHWYERTSDLHGLAREAWCTTSPDGW